MNGSGAPNACCFSYYGFRLNYEGSCGRALSSEGFPNSPTIIYDTLNTDIAVKSVSCKEYCFSNTNCQNKKWIIQNATGIKIDSVVNTNSLCHTFTGGRYFILLIIGNDTFTKTITTELLPFKIYGADTIN